eukprot:tig00021583_g22662.t2
MGAKAKGKQAASSQEEAASGAPPIDARPVRIARPKYISAWLDLDVRPRCSVCAAERLLPPAYVPACLARNIAELAGGGDLDRAIDLNDEPTGHLLQRHGLVCLACVPKVLAPTGAAGDEEGEIECPMLQSACSEPHPTLSALVPSSRVDGYLAYRAFVHEAERPESWTAAEGVSRAIQLAALTSCRRAPPTSGGAGPSSSRGPAARRPSLPPRSLPPGLPLGRPAAPARKGGADSNASTPRRSGRAGASQASTAAEGSSAAAAGGAPAPAPAPAARATRARRMAPAAAEDKDELEDEEPPLAIEAPKGPPAKRQRRPASSERRPPWESEKLQRILYDAYTCKREDFDEEDDEDGAGEGEGEARRPRPPARGGGGGSGGEPAGEDGPMKRVGGAEAGRTSDSGSDADAEHEGAGSGSGGEAARGRAVSERSEGTLSLRELERGLRRGVDAALVGIQLDGDPAARRALLLRAQHAGGSGSAASSSPRRAFSAPPPGPRARVGDGVSPADFVAFLPNLQRADEAALEEIEKRLDERVRKLVDSKGEPLEITEDVLKELREARLTDTPALRWCRQAVLALREATEHYAIETFEGSNLLAIHAKRITIQPKDMQLRKKIRGADE